MRTIQVYRLLGILGMLILLLNHTGKASLKITWEVLDVDYADCSILVKDLYGLEGRHQLVLPFGATLPYKGQWCDGDKDFRYYYIKIGGKWYAWPR